MASMASPPSALELETCTDNVYEYQTYAGKGEWVSDPKTPWVSEDKAESVPPDEIPLPDPDWTWVSNWKYEVKQNCTDRHGWEYASASSRFGTPGRDAKTEKARTDKARRRLWTRTRRRKDAAQTLTEMKPRVQNGLKNIHLVRIKIEEIMSNELSSSDSSEMMTLVRSVRSNIDHIYKLLDMVVNKGVSSAEMTIINKLRNDISKEENAINKAVGDRRPDGTAFSIPSKKQSFAERATAGASDGQASPTGGYRSDFAPLGQSDKRQSFAGSGLGARGVSGGSGGGGMEQAAAAAASGGVSKGAAGSFDPSMLGGSGPGGSREQGFFVARDYDQKQGDLIEKKLQAVGEAETQSILIEERTKAIEEMHADIVKVRELFKDLAILVEEQQVEVDRIYDNVDAAHAKTAHAMGEILEAQQLQKDGCIIS